MALQTVAQGYPEIKLICSGEKNNLPASMQEQCVAQKIVRPQFAEHWKIFSIRYCSPLLLCSPLNSGGFGLSEAVLDETSVSHRTTMPTLGRSVTNLSASQVPVLESGSVMMLSFHWVGRRSEKSHEDKKVNPVHLESNDHLESM